MNPNKVFYSKQMTALIIAKEVRAIVVDLLADDGEPPVTVEQVLDSLNDATCQRWVDSELAAADSDQGSDLISDVQCSIAYDVRGNLRSLPDLRKELKHKMREIGEGVAGLL